MSREAPCGVGEGRERCQYAEQQLALAEVGEPWTTPAERKASGGCAVLAGIASADAICCARLGRRSRSQDHRAAADLLRRVTPEGEQLAKDLDIVLADKDAMQYGRRSSPLPVTCVCCGQRDASWQRPAQSLPAERRERWAPAD